MKDSNKILEYLKECDYKQLFNALLMYEYDVDMEDCDLANIYDKWMKLDSGLLNDDIKELVGERYE